MSRRRLALAVLVILPALLSAGWVSLQVSSDSVLPTPDREAGERIASLTDPDLCFAPPEVFYSHSTLACSTACEVYNCDWDYDPIQQACRCLRTGFGAP